MEAMDKFSLILAALLTATIVVLITPGVLAMNRGKILRNIALWLAIVLALALGYRSFGPGKDMPISVPTAQDNDTDRDDAQASPAASGEQDYTPPKE